MFVEYCHLNTVSTGIRFLTWFLFFAQRLAGYGRQRADSALSGAGVAKSCFTLRVITAPHLSSCDWHVTVRLLWCEVQQTTEITTWKRMAAGKKTAEQNSHPKAEGISETIAIKLFNVTGHIAPKEKKQTADQMDAHENENKLFIYPSIFKGKMTHTKRTNKKLPQSLMIKSSAWWQWECNLLFVGL